MANDDRKHNHPENATPSLRDALIFRAKATLLQLRRAMRDRLSDEGQRFAQGNSLTNANIIAESRTPLWTESADSERILLAGKAHNLRLAIRSLNGVEVAADRVFSFWKQLGRTSRLKGYVAGRELREGCLIPNIGGGLCQLSNALYDAALRAGFEIVERHAHSQVIPGSLAEAGRDATVFWNYVDLRFKSSQAFRIEAALTADSLIVRFRGEPVIRRLQVVIPKRTNGKAEKPDELGSCMTCGTEDCFRHVKAQPSERDFGRAAFLLDEYWPEFDRFLSATKAEHDLLCLPLDGKRVRKANYAWTTAGFGALKQSRLLTLRRSYQSRRLASQGASRQRALLAASEELALRYASFLKYDVTQVTLMQQLLPCLWREGYLGGRTFDVLMTGLPLAVLQQRLDAAFMLHPESQTLADFRAPAWLVEAETEGLRQARKIITPHTEIAALYPGKSLLLDWAIPEIETPVQRHAGLDPHIVFPAATVGRKGIYELRAAMKGLQLPLVILGPLLEGEDFWDGVQVTRARAGEDWLDHATAVVLPAFVEHKPRRLLEAVARGVPVIASTACGLENVRGVISIPAGDVKSLRAEIERAITAEPGTRAPRSATIPMSR